MEKFVMVATINPVTLKEEILLVISVPYRSELLKELLDIVPDRQTKKKFTQALFAERCVEVAAKRGIRVTVSQKTISNYLSGSTKPDSDMLEFMGEVLRVVPNPDWTKQHVSSQDIIDSELKELREIYGT